MSNWPEAWKFADYVIHLIRTQQTQSEEFQILLRIYGREKLESIYKDFVRKKKEANDP